MVGPSPLCRKTLETSIFFNEISGKNYLPHLSKLRKKSKEIE